MNEDAHRECRRCRHYEKHINSVWGQLEFCGHLEAFQVSLVNGRGVQMLCAHMRATGRACGPKGLLYEEEGDDVAEPGAS